MNSADLNRINFLMLFIMMILLPNYFFGGNKRNLIDFRVDYNFTTVKPGNSYKLKGICFRKNGNSYDISDSEIRSKSIKRKQSWIDFIIECKGCKFSNGYIYINKDFRTYTSDTCIEIIIKHPSLPEKTIKKLKFNLEFSGETFFYFGGKSGFDGEKGGRGMRWFAREGVSGDGGGSGEDGEKGEDIAVYVKMCFLKNLKDTFLKILVRSILLDTSIVFFHNISKDKLTLSCSGGTGGNGAKGGRGSNGKDARDETDKKSGRPAGDGGDGGNGGNGGNGGKGGTISMYIEKDAVKFKPKIILDNFGGSGGKGGPGGSGGIGGSGSSTYPAGKDGQSGQNGTDGRSGDNGAPPVIFEVNVLPINF